LGQLTLVRTAFCVQHLLQTNVDANGMPMRFSSFEECWDGCIKESKLSTACNENHFNLGILEKVTDIALHISYKIGLVPLDGPRDVIEDLLSSR
jgi:hypothetical protein